MQWRVADSPSTLHLEKSSNQSYNWTFQVACVIWIVMVPEVDGKCDFLKWVHISIYRVWCCIEDDIIWNIHIISFSKVVNRHLHKYPKRQWAREAVSVITWSSIFLIYIPCHLTSADALDSFSLCYAFSPGSCTVVQKEPPAKPGVISGCVRAKQAAQWHVKLKCSLR